MSITTRQRTILAALISNCLVYEGEVRVWDHLRPTQVDPASRDLVTENYERSMRNAEAAGKALLDFLDCITEVEDGAK